MENLLKQKGEFFYAKIDGNPVYGRIQVRDGSVYLCQNHKNGVTTSDRFGFKYSWTVDQGTPSQLKDESVTSFRLISEKEFKDTLFVFKWEVNVINKNTYSFGCGEVKLTKQEIKDWYKIYSLRRSIIISPKEFKNYNKIQNIFKEYGIETINKSDLETIKKLIK